MYLVKLYKFVSINVFLYLIVFEILDLKLEKRGIKKNTKKSNDLRNLRRRLHIVNVVVVNIHFKS